MEAGDLKRDRPPEVPLHIDVSVVQTLRKVTNNITGQASMKFDKTWQFLMSEVKQPPG